MSTCLTHVEGVFSVFFSLFFSPFFYFSFEWGFSCSWNYVLFLKHSKSSFLKQHLRIKIIYRVARGKFGRRRQDIFTHIHDVWSQTKNQIFESVQRSNQCKSLGRAALTKFLIISDVTNLWKFLELLLPIHIKSKKISRSDLFYKVEK